MPAPESITVILITTLSILDTSSLFGDILFIDGIEGPATITFINPLVVNFRLLDSRFIKIYLILFGSENIGKESTDASIMSFTPFSFACI
jgi:hypothetical protein